MEPEISVEVMYKQIADTAFTPDDTAPMMRYLSRRVRSLENLENVSQVESLS